MITGLVTTTATGPVDVIKTNMFVGELGICYWSCTGIVSCNALTMCTVALAEAGGACLSGMSCMPGINMPAHAWAHAQRCMHTFVADQRC